MIDIADGNAIYYYHFDGLYSVAALSNVNGEIIERYSYDVFGEVIIYDSNGSELSVSSPMESQGLCPLWLPFIRVIRVHSRLHPSF